MSANKYKPEYCAHLIELMSQGLPFAAFAGEVNVTRKTLYDWAERFPEFQEAKDLGRAKQYTKLWRDGIQGLWSAKDTAKLDTQHWNKIMHNCFREDWAPGEQEENPHRDIEELKFLLDELQKLREATK